MAAAVPNGSAVSAATTPHAVVAAEAAISPVASSSRSTRVLTTQEAEEATAYAQRLGMPGDRIRISESMNTSYSPMYGDELLYIGTDVLPGAGPTANSLLSMRAAIAHEVVGHRGAATSGLTRSTPLAGGSSGKRTRSIDGTWSRSG